ncbi:MGDG synthase family glycosyltransferase [Opitutus terrae]|uniref:Monogalactosyldiacylglycerol synthase n=1 Tax=Opitutus terrae (strain DSM 11246 / JCM 15787 / PB90-1) TaxID=452637 RepID=B1ZT32_OPITP|nr:monogalactosyldiacylglycerol synthase [Opitutus terrae]ACB75821.1 Monogalactosyldiacylglycerol synthase [Opitutus terrae PB90-1]
MTPRILILTAGFGEGHNAAARALAAAFERCDPPARVAVFDAFAAASPRLNAASRQLYLSLINGAPRVWSRFYAWIDDSEFIQRRLWLFHREIGVLAERLRRDPPAAICCTYPLYAFFLQAIRARGVRLPPVYNVVTDSISIHSLWWRAACDGWFLPNADSADVLLRAGLPPTLVHVSGFPVDAAFRDAGRQLAPPDLAHFARPRVLHLVHSGTRHAEATDHALMKETDWDLTCAVGRDRALRARLTRLAARRPFPTRVLGWTDQIPRLLMTHHAVISKAGGATTQEAIAALCPMIVSQIVPGQEEGNYELLRRYGVGALATSPAAVLGSLRAAFADRGRVWAQWRAALWPLARPDAADDIARHVLGHFPAVSTLQPLSPDAPEPSPVPRLARAAA